LINEVHVKWCAENGHISSQVDAARDAGIFFGFITSVACGMTDSKTMDAQAGYEKAITATTLALAGGDNSQKSFKPSLNCA